MKIKHKEMKPGHKEMKVPDKEMKIRYPYFSMTNPETHGMRRVSGGAGFEKPKIARLSKNGKKMSPFAGR
ncbi:hypothetical protein [Roseiarcus sp.]|uniref:hypothetical protein n=1 Tax=Roseiarcus sp. TaxID=1969460 RepID=UPI003C528949